MAVLRNLLPAMIVVGILPGLRCSGVNNLPEFRDLLESGEWKVNDDDLFQAIIPAYSFQCSGRVTEWRACLGPGGNSENDRYYIQFQVWRPSNSTSGCYSLVGFNSPLNSDGTAGVLAPYRERDDPLQRCVELPVAEDQQIDVQEGDVIGYYVDNFRNDNEGGIQWDKSSSNVVIYYPKAGVLRQQIRSIYAIDAYPTDCGAPSADSDSYSISDSESAAPIISLTVATSSSTSHLTSTPTPTIVTPASPVTSQSCCSTDDGTPSDPAESADSRILAPYAATAILPLILIVSILTILLLLGRRRRSKRISKLQLSENVAYSVHDHEDKKSPTANQREEEDSVKFVNTTNPAYATTTQSISTSTNEVYYGPISVGTTENPAYGVGGSSSIPTGDNPSYGPVEGGGANTDLQYDYVAQ